MSISSSRRWTIGQFMWLIAALALALGLPRSSLLSQARVAGTIILALSLIALASFILQAVMRFQCPRCARMTLRRLARHPHYYRCQTCGLRVKKFGFTFGPWLDASGPQDAGKYQPATERSAWKGFAVQEDLSGSISGSLLSNKRGRVPAPPRPTSKKRTVPIASEVAARKVSGSLQRLAEIRRLTEPEDHGNPEDY
jgi:hypothetical protein